MDTKRCSSCGQRFEPRRNVPDQQYCSKRACQRARRARWQREKLRHDSDYRLNQAMAQRRWRARHRQYWRRYRLLHPEYTARRIREMEDRLAAVE